MIDSLPDALKTHLKRLGQSIDIGERPTVFDGGLVGMSDQTESEVIRDVAQGKPYRSPAGPRQGQRARPRRTQAARDYFRSEAVESAFGQTFRGLTRHYKARAFEDKNGLWVVVTSYPLGSQGPQATFFIALPLDSRVAPRAWAFVRTGHGAELASLKHTNFPDASICAFIDEDGAWPNPDGLTGLVDVFSIWMIKKWHREAFGWWPGKQFGACALYRRLEFDPREQCGCLSGQRYVDCCLEDDLLVHETHARNRFRQLFKGDYEDRMPPEPVMEAARSSWAKIPQMASVFAYRIREQEPLLTF